MLRNKHYNTCHLRQNTDDCHVPPVCCCQEIATSIADKEQQLKEEWDFKRQHLYFSFQDFVIHKLAELSLGVTEES